MTDWNEAVPGDVILGKDGKEWTVTDGGLGGSVTISRPGAKPYTGVPSGPVTYVRRAPARTSPALDAVVAKGLVATKFGGVEIGKRGKDRTRPYATPVEFDEPGSLLAHLRIFHAALSDEPTLAGLTKYHASLHGPEFKVGDFYEPHVHDPDYESL